MTEYETLKERRRIAAEFTAARFLSRDDGDFPELVGLFIEHAKQVEAEITLPAPDSGDRNAALAIATGDPDNTDCDTPDGGGRFYHPALSTPEPVPDDRDAEIERLKADIATLQDANFRQANCIHLTAQALGPDRSATIEGLPKAAAHLREALERIATVDMGGGFLGAKACRDLANKTLTAWKEIRDATN